MSPDFTNLLHNARTEFCFAPMARAMLLGVNLSGYFRVKNSLMSAEVFLPRGLDERNILVLRSVLRFPSLFATDPLHVESGYLLVW